MTEIKVSDEFHKFYEKERIWEENTWLGIPMWKLPFDAFVIQELICRIQPDWIIETGTGYGGSAYFYASICHLINHGKVITIDIQNKFDKQDVLESIMNRIYQFIGSSTNHNILETIQKMVRGCKVMVLLDSWHTAAHVRQELEMYSPLVSLGSYIIVEDSHANGNPVPWEWEDGGPMEAIEQFLERHDDFKIDKECEKHIMTFNPKGYLQRVKVGENQ